MSSTAGHKPLPCAENSSPSDTSLYRLTNVSCSRCKNSRLLPISASPLVR